jgi:hypothetical protein
MPPPRLLLLRLIAGLGLGGIAGLALGGCQVTDPRRPTLLVPPPMVYALTPEP